MRSSTRRKVHILADRSANLSRSGKYGLKRRVKDGTETVECGEVERICGRNADAIPRSADGNGPVVYE